MKRVFANYREFYNVLQNQDLTKYPALLFFYNATTNSMGCNCDGGVTLAINRYKTLLTTLTEEDKSFLKRLFEASTLELHQDSEIYTIILG